jgi:uncharacterized hydrophobic protein (TIGR00271 family)
MVHVRAVSPKGVTAHLVDALTSNEAVLNLVVLSGAAQGPDGDILELDVINGGANGVIEQLRLADVVDRGSIVVEPVGACLSRAYDVAERRQSRFEAVTPIWALVDAQIDAGALYPPSWYSLLVIAGVIGAVGILINSQILIVAAMVVGPEYGAITAMSRAGVQRDGRTFRRGLVALGAGFGLAVIASLVLSLMVRGAGRTPKAFELGLRPVSHLINTPDGFSVLVAILAGIVGILSLTESRASTLIGVFVSVTTIPAAADIGVSVAYGSWHEAWGSLVQLLLNVSILVVVGIFMLVLQRRLWDRVIPLRP